MQACSFFRRSICMDIDITITAVIRPEILEKTLESFFRNVFTQTHNYRAVINIDPLGDTSSTLNDMRDVIAKYFTNSHSHASFAPNFPKAVKWVWSHSRTDLVFHLEDMWLSKVPINFEDLVDVMTRYEKLASINLYKNILAEGSPPPEFYPHYDKIEDRRKFLRIDRPLLSPGLYRGKFVRRVAELMSENDNPELQIWGDKDSPQDGLASSGLKSYLREWDYSLYTGHWWFPFWICRQPAVSMLQGRIWKKKHGFVKKNHFAPWEFLGK